MYPRRYLFSLSPIEEGAMLDETLREILLSIAEEIASEGDKSTDKKEG
jgi:hypothetical protein